MKVQEIMERAGVNGTGRAIAYIKDALEEIILKSETHIKVERQDLKKDQRYYDLPHDSVKIVNIRCKNQNNSEDKYETIPRSIYVPARGDDDGV
tara:strand:- start:17 stop:298 length:282 start_codon:yes stop_codon:yes gene_type:complete